MTRSVRISSLSLYLPSGVSTVEDNVMRAKLAISSALEEGTDIILLPEFFAMLGTDPETYQVTVEKAAKSWERQISPFQELAKKGSSYIIFNGPKEEGGNIFNVCSVIDRHGEILGHYRKTHLAPGEESLISPGDTYPVFETDFGRIACMICMDIHYPEIARIYALRGADILFWPTMSWGPTDRSLTVLLAARAIDNQIYCVHANFAGLPFLPGKPRGRACIVGPDGELRADTGHRPGVATARVDLDEGYEYWVTGSLKGRLPTLKEAMLGLRRPETYTDLVREDIPWSSWQVADPPLVDPFDELSKSQDESTEFLFPNS